MPARVNAAEPVLLIVKVREAVSPGNLAAPKLVKLLVRMAALPSIICAPFPVIEISGLGVPVATVREPIPESAVQLSPVGTRAVEGLEEKNRVASVPSSLKSVSRFQ